MPPIAPPLCGSVLLVAPQKELCQKIAASLASHGHTVTSCTNAVDALNCSTKREFDVVLVDVCLQGMNNLDLVGQLRANGGKEEIVRTSLTDIEADVEPWLGSPFQLDELGRAVEEAVRRRRQADEIVQDRNGTIDPSRIADGQSRSSAKSKHPVTTPLIGRSPLMKELYRTIGRIAPIDSNVLITGATGTGKELVARAIHEQSARRNQPFVDVNSSAIPDTLFETEFFGHQRGTFTGAYETRRGLFERASGGTLFLDEVDTLNLAAQAKLLRVLQERHLRRLGGHENISVDVRIIAATSTNLKAATANGTFRPDLYFRLRVMPLHVPQLRERVEDIELLVENFLRCHSERSGKQQRRFSPEAMRAMTDYTWPGNVRELENAIEYALALGSDDVLGLDDLPPDMFDEETDDRDDRNVLIMPINASLAEVERRHILSVFDRCGGHHIKAAAALRIDRRTLYRKLQQYNMELQVNSA